jgi:osmotically-inducible protein OsmY
MQADIDIQHDIRNALAQVLLGNIEKLTVQVQHGVVTLTGSLPSDREKVAVDSAIRRMPGVRLLIDEALVLSIEATSEGVKGDTARPWFPPS